MNRLIFGCTLAGLSLLLAPRHGFAQEHFKFKSNTSDFYSILINATRLDGLSLDPGDEVGVFTSDSLCVGATKLSGIGVFSIAAWVDDPQTSEVDGYTVGDTVHFRFWDASRAIEAEAHADSFLAGDGTFGFGPLARIDTLTATFNKAPTLNLPGTFVIDEDDTTQVLTLDNYVTDIDNADAELSWTVTGTANIQVRYDSSKREARLVPAPNWNGSLVLGVKVEDPSQAAASGTLPVTVTPVNDTPSIPQLMVPVWLQTGAVLKWSKSVDPDVGDVIRYQIQIAADSSFATGTIAQTAATEELAISTIGNQLTVGKVYYWRVQSLDQQNASAGFSRQWSFKYEGNNVVTEVEGRQSTGLPLAFALHQSYPNPVRQTPDAQAVIRLDLPRAERVTLQIFNLLGQRVRELMNTEISPGFHRLVWDGRDDHGKQVPIGVYFYRLQAGKMSGVRKLVVAR